MLRDGYSQSELARLVGTRQSTIQGWLAGAVPRRKTLTELANLFNVSVVWLENGTENYERDPLGAETSIKFAESREEGASPGLAARYGLTNKQLVDLIEMLIKRVLAGEVPVSNLATAERLLEMIRQNENFSIPR